MNARTLITALATLALAAGCATTNPTLRGSAQVSEASVPPVPLLTLADVDKNDANAPAPAASQKALAPRPTALAQIGGDLSVAPAGGVSNRTIVKRLPNSTAQAILRSLGIAFRTLKPGVYRFRLGGYTVLFFNKKRNCQLYAGFRNKPGLAAVNAWNKSKRFSRAYLDRVNDAVIESDLDFDGGTTVGAIKEFIRTFKLSVTAYARHVRQRP